ncbi:hypothetical protein ACHAXA_003022 [Cyclostephanos tholiformis]|uniref:Uncharacterized protein n=1 Tax=Cyclostephanos tholiformis TaxID=382380 RepID=A0ABD3R8H1_9STRA
MVVLEAAAITAGSVAAYKGGKAAVAATAKTIKSKLSLNQRERTRDKIYQSRKEERTERFAKVNEYRESVTGKIGGEGGSTTAGGFSWKKSDGSSCGGGLFTSTSWPSSAAVTDAAPTKRSTTNSSSGSWRSVVTTHLVPTSIRVPPAGFVLLVASFRGDFI